MTIERQSPQRADRRIRPPRPTLTVERYGGSRMDTPVKVFTVVALLSLPTVMFGGYSLLRLISQSG